ncbi:carboxymuconolactone decarboxylase family protein [Gordonia sp. zg691]|uniref:Carboxymuconolactone decarboxylase family protein n=1 Tax=Gordonia jinghuaiqii TaxID=2758710 RepID=A0A7D7R5V0_9ACTN|nr:carboxymuconolactone decarboxylase family protein [Gordonia jinghuaiqii]MBD0862043.1 carboxymuconolactone decarboxylase family protein [Gordonia jinghuaiqii]MCR5978731.1 carboxymuconolactone decarboxylase family protein [Gordonia jinghuaiqii]QMT03792.1 carboxymuconolactone decarboxylase family protein [Gordonia jinghuaiqii]
MWIPQDNPAVYKALVALQRASSAGIDPELAELLVLRASQLNGCAYCLHMHTSDALAKGIDPHRLMLIATWRDAGALFTPAERAALALTESVTLIGENGVPAHVFDTVREHFDATQAGQLVATIVMINAWNRIALAGGYPAGLDERRQVVRASADAPG